jgi:hypothetical protein
MAPPQLPIRVLEPYAWERSTVTQLALGELVAAGQLSANEEGRPAEWIVPPSSHLEPNPPEGYVVSFLRYHERGFNAPASTFMRALCYHYGVELHNFAPNAISQAATFVGVCEGYLGIPVNWELWVHLFRAELITQPTTEPRTRRAVRAGGMSLAVRGQLKNSYIPCTMTTNNAGWERGWFYLRNAEPGLPPYTGRVFKERPDRWGYGLPTANHRARQDSVLAALQRLAREGLNAMGVLAFLHHRRIVPLMQRPLCIFEMTEAANPVDLARSRMLPTPLERPYALTRARSAVDTRTPPPAGRTPWDLEMLPTGPLVSRVFCSVLVLVLDFVS